MSDLKEVEDLVVDACDNVTFDGTSLWNDKEIKRNKRDEKKYLKRMKKAYRKALMRQRKQNIEKVSKSYRKVMKNFLITSQTTKILIGFIFVNCTIIEGYSMIVMYLLGDLSALTPLIGSCVAETFAFAVYCCKSYLETKAEKQHETDMNGIEVKYDDNINNEPIMNPDDLMGDDCGHEEIEPGVFNQ